MERRKIGSLEVSVIGLGANNFGGRIDEERSREVLDAAMDHELNFLDTADVYGESRSEEIIGRWIGPRRSRIVLATKFGMPVNGASAGGSPQYVRSAIDASLRRLQTDYIDLYIYHRPDPATPIAETLDALGSLVAEGKVREIGCSNFSVAQLQEAETAARQGGPRVVNLQNNYSLLHREPELGVLSECERLEIGFVPYFPLAAGLLTGKYRKDGALPEGARIAKMPEERRQQALSDEKLTIVEQLIAFAERRGHNILELAFSWLLAQRAVSSVIAGATSRAQVEANALAAAWQLASGDLDEVGEITASCLSLK